MDRMFVSSVEKACVIALIEKGFESPRSRTRFIRLDNEFLGWVGLNRGNYSDYLQINPFIGLHCIPIMRLKSELAKEKYKEGDLASYSIHMGEIAPDVPQFIFNEQTDLAKEAGRLANEIFIHGVPWMKARANYEALTPMLEAKIEMLGGFPEKYASALYFSGKQETAVQFVQERTDLFDPNYEGTYSLHEKFGKPFLEMLDGEKGQKSC